MNFGEPGRGHQGDWTLGIEEARPIFEAAIECGLFYFDTADIYGVGACEEVVGQLLRDLLPRDEYVINTKTIICCRYRSICSITSSISLTMDCTCTSIRWVTTISN